MSGIAGIVRLDGSPVCSGEIEAMVASMQRRGPDAQRTWSGEGAALGQVLLTTTPEAVSEIQPWVDRETGCVVVSDSRLDNRSDLRRALHSTATHRDDFGDAELLLRAWQKWGKGCAERLLGDFAFAIWDQRHRTLFCARDVMGVRPFYYEHKPGKRFVLAAETAAILTQSAPSDLNEGRIADAIVSELEGIDKTSTFFESIKRLPPASYLILRDGQLVTGEYWDPLARAPATLAKTDDEWIDELRATLQDAVRCRLRSAARVGSMLSGGIDSSAVVALADEILRNSGRELLPTFSAINSVGDCQETAGVRAILASRNLEANLVDLQSKRIVSETARERLESLAEPFDGTMTLIDAVYRCAAGRGVRSVMDGMPADNLYTTAGQTQRLLAAGSVGDAFNEATLAHHDCDSAHPRVRASLMLAAHFAPGFVRNIRKRQVDRASFRKLLIDKSLIDKAYAHDVDLWGRFMQYRADMNRNVCVDLPVRALSCMTASYITAAVERYGRVAATHGIEPRHPFLDKRVVEFHAWVPIRLRRKGSVAKWALRRAIESLVPHGTAWAGPRGHLGWRFNMLGVEDLYAEYSCQELVGALGRRLDTRKTYLAIDSWRRRGDNDSFNAFHAGIRTSAWLQSVASSGRPGAGVRSGGGIGLSVGGSNECPSR